MKTTFTTREWLVGINESSTLLIRFPQTIFSISENSLKEIINSRNKIVTNNVIDMENGDRSVI